MSSGRETQSIRPPETIVPPLPRSEQLTRMESRWASTGPHLATATRTKYKGLIQGFLDSAERFVSREALVVDGKNLSYRELRDSAAAIARTILDREPESFPLAAILASRSETAYAGVLGILGAGEGYVPLNPQVPVARTGKMLALSGSRGLVVGPAAFWQFARVLPEIDRSLTVILPDCGDAAEIGRAHV